MALVDTKGNGHVGPEALLSDEQRGWFGLLQLYRFFTRAWACRQLNTPPTPPAGSFRPTEDTVIAKIEGQ